MVAVEHILGLMQPAKLVTAALAVDHQLVTAAAAAAVAAAPTLLAELSLRKPQVQKVWIEALKREDGAWQIRANIGALRNEVFDSLLGDDLPSDLLEHLVSSPIGNVLDYPRRADVWRALPDRCRNVCLPSTAKAWIRSLPDRVFQAEYLDPEYELAIFLASPPMLQEMTAALQRLAFKDVLNVFTGNSQLPDALLTEVFATFYQSNRHPSGEEFDRIARLVAPRHWRNLTRSLLRRYGLTDDLRGFFSICADHLGLLGIEYGIGFSCHQRASFTTFLSKPPANFIPQARWMARFGLEPVAIPAQLDVSGTGKRQWDAAIRKIRNGNAVRAPALIAAMCGDYPLNNRLDYLAQEYR